MKNRLLGLSILVFFALAAAAQDSKPAVHTFDGQIMKIDMKGKELTIKGPKEGVMTTDPLPAGRGNPVGGAGGRRSRSGGGGADMRRFEDVQTKIGWNDETEFISETEGGTLQVSGLRVGDYVKVTATMKGSKVLATTIRRVTAAGS